MNRRKPNFEDRAVPTLATDVLVRAFDTESIAWASNRPAPVLLDPVASILARCFDGEGQMGDLVNDVVAEVGVMRDVAIGEVLRVEQLLRLEGLLADAETIEGAWPDNPTFFDPPSP